MLWFNQLFVDTAMGALDYYFMIVLAIWLASAVAEEYVKASRKRWGDASETIRWLMYFSWVTVIVRCIIMGFLFADAMLLMALQFSLCLISLMVFCHFWWQATKRLHIIIDYRDELWKRNVRLWASQI